MSRNKIELAIGIIVAMLPFIGFPSIADTAILFAAGIFLCISSLVAHVQARSASVVRRHTEINRTS